ncbi:MAG: tetratricopeptide repeat protein, partial [Nitrospinota bacterium]|nr:tetratricopeptide repeat protein [Nitrospinota bacterium]
TALIFAVHPLQTQAVAYIWQRGTSMVAMFYLGSMTLYLLSALEQKEGASPRRWKAWLGLSLACAVAAMFTKQLSVTLPVAIIMLDFFFISGSFSAIKKRAPYLRLYLPLLLLAPLLTVMADAGELRDVLTAEGKLSPFTYLITQFNVIVLYLGLFLWPTGQNVDHHIILPETFMDYAPSLMLLLALLAFGMVMFRANRIASFGIIFFFLAMTVESSILPMPPNDLAFEHRMYLPMAGLILALISLGVGALLGFMSPTRARTVVVAVMIAGSAPLSWATYQRNLVWSSQTMLWQDAVAKSPGKVRPYHNLAVGLMAERKVNQALDTLMEAEKIDPDNTLTLANIGVALNAKGDIAGAAEYYLAAIRQKPGLPHLAHRLGRAYTALAQYDNAVQYLEMAVNITPRSILARMDLGMALAKSGNDDDAISIFNSIIEMDPSNAKARYHLSMALRRQGAMEPAERMLEKAKELGFIEPPQKI